MGRWLIGACVVVLVQLTVSASVADEFSTEWAASAKSQARLVAADKGLAGFEIRLAPGAITYWRDPGDAGVPPAFDFSGSENIVKVEPVFPSPERIAEADGTEAFGYEHDVVLPLRIKRADPDKPATLDLRASYAVCERICLPARAHLKLSLPDAASHYAGVVEAALAASPRAVAPKDFGDLSQDGADAWRLCAPREGVNARDLFVESPEGWRIAATPAANNSGRDCFKLTLLEKPKGAEFPVALRLTMTGQQPVETTMEAGKPE